MRKLTSVLLIDDDHITNFLNQQLLLSLGVTDHCLVAENGTQALALLAEAGDACPPALVLLDIHMPIMDGVSFLEAYLSPFTPAPIIVILSSSEHPRDQSRLALLPIAGWVVKPLTREKVNDLLQQHFNRQLPAALLLPEE